jgi:hypothetical protein
MDIPNQNRPQQQVAGSIKADPSERYPDGWLASSGRLIVDHSSGDDCWRQDWFLARRCGRMISPLLEQFSFRE